MCTFRWHFTSVMLWYVSPFSQCVCASVHTHMCMCAHVHLIHRWNRNDSFSYKTDTGWHSDLVNGTGHRQTYSFPVKQKVIQVQVMMQKSCRMAKTNSSALIGPNAVCAHDRQSRNCKGFTLSLCVCVGSICAGTGCELVVCVCVRVCWVHLFRDWL